MAAKFVFLQPLKITIRACAPFSSTTSRKNYLRPKIIETLSSLSVIPASSFNFTTTQPTLLPQNPEEIDQKEPQTAVHSPENAFTAEEKTDLPAPLINKPGNNFPINSALKFVLYFLGVLLFQTISAVLILGVSHTVKEEQNSYKKLPTHDEAGHMDEEEIEKRVREIQKLARLARQREQLEKQIQSPNETRGNSSIEAAIALDKAPPLHLAEGKRQEEQKDRSQFKSPYILAIFIKSIEGYYSFSVSSKGYTLAFEDFADANNFGFVLRSHFEEKEKDFSVDIVRISTQDLQEEDRSKIAVVEKGKLNLYANQTLEEIEKALQSLFSELS